MKTRKTKSKQTRNKVISVWYIEPFGSIVLRPFTVIQYPDGELNCMSGDTLASSQTILRETAQETGYELRETWGVHGLAKTDPYWDGQPTFRCGNCNILHHTHENVAENLYKRSKALLAPEKAA